MKLTEAGKPLDVNKFTNAKLIKVNRDTSEIKIPYSARQPIFVPTYGLFSEEKKPYAPAKKTVMIS